MDSSETTRLCAAARRARAWALKTTFVAMVSLLAMGYGAAATTLEIFPHELFVLAASGFKELSKQLTGSFWAFKKAAAEDAPTVRGSSRGAYTGLNLVTRLSGLRGLSVDVLDMEGRTIHRWDVDWFSLWPDPAHLPERYLPRTRPGTHVHGAVLMGNGDLVFNFEHLGLLRVDPNGEVVWRLPVQTHHSVHLHDDGTLWVCGQKSHEDQTPRLPGRVPPFDEYLILQVSPEGEVLQQWSVPDLLADNGYHGLLYLASVDNMSTETDADRLHLNDVEPFSASLGEGFFTRGDVLVSLRNVNTVFVFNQNTRRIKFLSTGRFVRQHDPDFVDGNSFSVFDNNNLSGPEGEQYSRIVLVTPAENRYEALFEGSPEVPFYTHVMGKHQWLPNGNVLLTESSEGRAIEVDPSGRVVWEYLNHVGDGYVGLVEEVQRVPLLFGDVLASAVAGSQVQ